MPGRRAGHFALACRETSTRARSQANAVGGVGDLSRFLVVVEHHDAERRNDGGGQTGDDENPHGGTSRDHLGTWLKALQMCSDRREIKAARIWPAALTWRRRAAI